MAREQPPFDFASIFSIDVTPTASGGGTKINAPVAERMVGLMEALVEGQSQQNQLLERLIAQMSAGQKARQHELGQWKESNPQLSQACRTAAETLNRVQSHFIERLTEEVNENEDCLLDGEFMMHEFVDRFGPRLAHLNGVLQVLTQLGAPPPQTADAAS